jgi:hypothetical protein
METKLGHGVDLPGTTAGILLQHDCQCEESSMRTLVALSQDAFSWVLNDLHSLRTFGVTHWHKATVDQRTFRATEMIEGTSMGRRLGMRRGINHLRLFIA